MGVPMWGMKGPRLARLERSTWMGRINGGTAGIRDGPYWRGQGERRRRRRRRSMVMVVMMMMVPKSKALVRREFVRSYPLG